MRVRSKRRRTIADVDADDLVRVLLRERDVDLQVLLAAVADEDELALGKLGDDRFEAGPLADARLFPQLRKRAARPSIFFERDATDREPCRGQEFAQNGPELNWRV